jgi:hypothetical protein
MASKRTFNPKAALESARRGELKGVALRRAIMVADEFGNVELVQQLTALVSPKKRSTPSA